jgi:hypothetical protein
MRRFTTIAATALATFAVAAPAGAAGPKAPYTAHAAAGLGQKACHVLDASLRGVPVSRAIEHALGNGCVAGAPGQAAHGALLTLGCAATPARARALVRRNILRGYRQVNIGADLAGMATSPGRAGAVLAVNRTTALFALGGVSKPNAMKAARQLARALRADRVC